MKRDGTVLILLGSLLILAAAILTGYNLMESEQAKTASADIVSRLESVAVTHTATEEEHLQPQPTLQPDHVRFPNMEMPVIMVDDQPYIGTLQIPELELELPVISDWNYDALKIAPCRYRGSVYSGGLILMAHNYDSHFGRLHTLRPGAEICFTDTLGNCFLYEVADLEEISGTDIEAMLTGDWDLTLFTCTYGGKNRVVVRCFEREP